MDWLCTGLLISTVIYYNWKFLFFNGIRLYNYFYNKPIIFVESPIITQIITKDYSVYDLVDIDFFKHCVGPITIFFTLKGNNYIFRTNYEYIRKSNSFLPYNDNTIVDNSITIAMLNGKDITDILRMYAGPKGNFYSDLGFSLSINEIFPDSSGILDIMIGDTILEVELSDPIPWKSERLDPYSNNDSIDSEDNCTSNVCSSISNTTLPEGGSL